MNNNAAKHNKSEATDENQSAMMTSHMINALRSPEIAELMKSFFTTGVQELLTPLNERIGALERRVAEHDERLIKRADNNDAHNDNQELETNEQLIELNKHVKELETQINNMKIQTQAPQNTAQTAKTNNVVITGLSDQGESTTQERVENLLKELNIEIDNFQVKRIVTECPGRPLPVLMELSNPWEKRKLFAARKNLRNTDGLNKVFINEDLTKKQAELFYFARKAKKEHRIAAAWTLNGVVYIAKIGETFPTAIDTKASLEREIPNFKCTKDSQ